MYLEALFVVFILLVVLEQLKINNNVLCSWKNRIWDSDTM